LKERRKARYLALRLLYTREITGESLDSLIESTQGEMAGTGGLPSFTTGLLRQIDGESERIDGIIQGYANRWSIERMPAIDRSLLRMGIAEILFQDDVPPSVTINECVELAKRFSTEESGKFINGVLGHFIRDLESGEETT
jgi:transcription antitermination protein NusB